MKLLTFWWLESQTFYKKLHQDALELVSITAVDDRKTWADVGCATGLMSEFVLKNSYSVHSFDIDRWMIWWAKLIIIEPTELLTRKNVLAFMRKTGKFYHYKHLYLWAKAREGKAIEALLFDEIAGFTHQTLLDGMVRVSVKNTTLT